MPRDNLSKVFIVIISLLIGLLLGFWIYSSIAENISLPTETTFKVDLFDIFQIVINISLAVYIARILNKRNEEDKVEKDLLIKFFTEFNDDFKKSFRSLLFKKDLELVETNNHIKRYRMRFESLVDLAKTHKFLNESSATVHKLRENFSKIRDLLTDTPQREETTIKGVVVKSGILILEPERQTQVIEVIYDINKLAFNLIVEMNRSSRK